MSKSLIGNYCISLRQLAKTLRIKRWWRRSEEWTKFNWRRGIVK